MAEHEQQTSLRLTEIKLKCDFLFVFLDVLALAASISELSELTRKARTAQWCALQVADKENPSLSKLGIDIHSMSAITLEDPGCTEKN